jgi:acetyltransferase-like isoleucine patch superfamily enzyme
MTKVTTLAHWSDDRGNCIEYPGSVKRGVEVEFTGRDNKLVVHGDANLRSLSVFFNCSNGYAEIGPADGAPSFSGNLRVGQDSQIVIGSRVSATGRVGFSAVEGTTIRVGHDVMFATDNQIRADDGHPIFDVRTGMRVNTATSIEIGDHVWLGWGAVVLAGSEIGQGSVVGIGSVVKGRFPNNCVIAGSPATVVRRDIAWERPHLSLDEPYYKPDASTVERSAYWDVTHGEEQSAAKAEPTSGPRRRRWF